jgi:hypothetical protein
MGKSANVTSCTAHGTWEKNEWIFAVCLKLFGVFFTLTSFRNSSKRINHLCAPFTGRRLPGDNSIVEHGYIPGPCDFKTRWRRETEVQPTANARFAKIVGRNSTKREKE